MDERESSLDKCFLLTSEGTARYAKFRILRMNLSLGRSSSSEGKPCAKKIYISWEINLDFAVNLSKILFIPAEQNIMRGHPYSADNNGKLAGETGTEYDIREDSSRNGSAIWFMS